MCGLCDKGWFNKGNLEKHLWCHEGEWEEEDGEEEEDEDVVAAYVEC